MKIPKLSWALWIVIGATYGLGMRVLFGSNAHFSGLAPYSFNLKVISTAFLLGTPVAVGAIVIYGIRDSKPSIAKMVFAPWVAILLALAGSALTLIEGSVCIALASPIFLVLSSIGGLIMGLTLRWTNKGKTTFNSILFLPIILVAAEPAIPQQPQMLEERVSIQVAAPPHRIWEEILNARNIRKDELPANFTHWIGVPRPVEGVNVMTPEGEVRHSKWERGVNFSALVTNRVEDRSITWNYTFTADSFPKGSLDDHVKIGGEYFNLYDTTFNLTPISENVTNLEIISHYQVTTDVNFYAVPVAQFIANDFMTTILHLYKTRSERAAG